MSLQLSKSFFRAAPLLIVLSTSTACGRITRTKQCRALIARTNPALDEIVALTHADPGRARGAAYVAAAGRYEHLAKEVGPLEFATEDMAKYVAEYAGVLNNAARSLRALGAALDAENTGDAERLSRELERIVSHERSVVVRMDAWCQP